MSKGATAVYLYCVVRAARRPAMTRVPEGLPEGTPPAAHRLAPSLWLITSDVPIDVYGPDTLESRLRDLEWVSTTAVAHEAVVEHFSKSRTVTVVPMKLFTMFTSLERAIEDVSRGRDGIERVVRRIAGCEEWGVRVMRRPASAVAAAAGNGGGPRSGTAFLAARKEARDATAVARAAAAARADEAFTRLRRYAKDARLRERGAEPGTNPPILEAAFLVTVANVVAFKAEARRQAASLAAAGADMQLTGPWPAYNFVDAAGERA
jgi:gas vesicle protein GvpL/GvpF